ncbi:DNA-directed RNA polymerase III subunit RPC10 [Cryptosporidium parvum]
MAQQYIYNTDYINEINEEVYKEIGISHELEQFARKGIIPNKNNNLSIHNNTTYVSRPIKSVTSENAANGKLNSVAGFGVVALTFLIIYLLNKILFWFIVISIFAFCISVATRSLGNIEASGKKLPF